MSENDEKQSFKDKIKGFGSGITRRFRRQNNDSPEDLRTKVTSIFKRSGKASLSVNTETITRFALEAFNPTKFSNYGKFITLVLVCWFLADIPAQLIEKYLPEPPVSRVGSNFGRKTQFASLNDYEIIFSRNLFSSLGRIPGEANAPGLARENDEPVPSTLNMNLIGTLVLRNELMSIATLEDKGDKVVYPVRKNDEIPSKLKVMEVQANRIIFMNLSAGRPEYLALPEDQVTNKVGIRPQAIKGKGIEQVNENHFSISRAKLEEKMADINMILTQARAAPNFKDGQPYGYKLFQIVPGSIYSDLGLINGDLLVGLDGQDLKDPSKAFQMLQDIKTKQSVEIVIERDGKKQTLNYDIN